MLKQPTVLAGALPARQWPRPRPAMEPLHPNASYRPLPPRPVMEAMPPNPNRSSTRRPSPRIKKTRTEHDVLVERSGFYPVYRYNGREWQYYSDRAGGRLHFPTPEQATGFLSNKSGGKK